MSAQLLFEVRFAADPSRLKGIRAVVEQAALIAGCRAPVAAEVVLAVNEACMNVIQHAYHGDPTQDVRLYLEATDTELRCRIEDSAALADLDAIRPRELAQVRPGGLGTHFIAELMDTFEYGHRDGGAGNFLELRKRIS